MQTALCNIVVSIGGTGRVTVVLQEALLQKDAGAFYRIASEKKHNKTQSVHTYDEMYM